MYLRDFQFSAPNAGGGTDYFKFKPDDDYTGLTEVTVNAVLAEDEIEVKVPRTSLVLSHVGESYTNYACTLAREACVLSMNFESGARDIAGFNTYLDYRHLRALDDGTQTLNNIPFAKNNLKTIKVIDAFSGEDIPIASHVGNTITLSEARIPYSQVYIGYQMSSAYTFSEQLFKQPQANKKTVVQSAQQRIRRGHVYMTETGDFNVIISGPWRDDVTYGFVAEDVRGSYTIGEADSYATPSYANDGSFTFPVMNRGEDTEIKVETTGHLALSLQSAEFEAMVVGKSQRDGS